MKHRLIAAACLLLAIGFSGVAKAANDQGQASAYPWSGYWWQHRTGGLQDPLGKYDSYAKTAAAQWEQENNVSLEVPEWYGHCHAWSAASICEKEPQAQRVLSQIAFGVGDQKGLLTALHAADIANSYGDRFGDGEGSEDRNDLAPDELWRLLQLYVKQNKVALILDLESGEEVWNYPIYQYSVEYSKRNDGWTYCDMELIAADNDVNPDYLGTQYTLHQYTFRVKISGGAIVSGSGEWIGNSATEHPDFAWYPYVAVAENPYVEPDTVGEIVGYPVGGERPLPDDGANPRVEPPTIEEVPESHPDAPEEVGSGSEIDPIRPLDTDSILSANELVAAVRNRGGNFDLDVTVDRFDGGDYKQGSDINLTLKSEQDGFLYLFDVHRKTGRLLLLYPSPGATNRIEGGKQYQFGGRGGRPLLQAEGLGNHDIKALVTKQPIKFSGYQQVRKPMHQQKPQTLHVHPTLDKQIRQDLQKDAASGAPQAPRKLQDFAQDVCLYVVLPRDAE